MLDVIILAAVACVVYIIIKSLRESIRDNNRINGTNYILSDEEYEEFQEYKAWKKNHRE